MSKYIVYATEDNGDGHVTKIGEYDDVSEIFIRTSLYGENVVITIEEEQSND